MVLFACMYAYIYISTNSHFVNCGFDPKCIIACATLQPLPLTFTGGLLIPYYDIAGEFSIATGKFEG